MFCFLGSYTCNIYFWIMYECRFWKKILEWFGIKYTILCTKMWGTYERYFSPKLIKYVSLEISFPQHIWHGILFGIINHELVNFYKIICVRKVVLPWKERSGDLLTWTERKKKQILRSWPHFTVNLAMCIRKGSLSSCLVRLQGKISSHPRSSSTKGQWFISGSHLSSFTQSQPRFILH